MSLFGVPSALSGSFTSPDSMHSSINRVSALLTPSNSFRFCACGSTDAELLMGSTTYAGIDSIFAAKFVT